MERFKALLSSGKNKGKYKAVSRSSCDNDEPREAFAEDEIVSLRRTIWYLGASLAIVSSALFLTLAYIAANGSHNYIKDHGSVQRIGSDPNGFVPPEIGEPPRWTFLADPSSPYYIEEDTFYDINKTIATVTRIKSIHNSSNVLVNGNYADWVHPDGNVTKLPPYYSTVSNRQTYIIRGFHQMHCLLSITEEYGFRYHNMSSQWSPKHVAHCLNAIREAIMCLADATPMSYVNGFAVGHVTDDQQFMCRDWTALRRWANEPERGIRYKNLSPPGSKLDKNTEIIPFPQLSEEEKSGLA
ncbi:hypothetical protein INS49_005220 [Diaporthe citri]|uniref:uncharacterized protein n=1 Tax=Diaporthe citri TaxID=83186 RepID=UPI001C7FE615|nr:uncharacterized protein INS49_005220 [Diaporthe citri]KAG6353962.1 hypothetical protein INS49_005220 [Diaporthe citri]